ncbi:MAG: hypothetical protein KAQ96_04165, partial [Thermoplasmata archaeon]|nr:hypothetical protein [Thermoplasmata archaeon]
MTDRVMMALRAFDGGFIYAEEDKPVRTSQGAGEDGEYVWTDMGNGYVSLRASNGMYLSLQDDNSIAATAYRMGTNERFRIVPIPGGKIALMANNSKYVTVRDQGSILANAASIVPEGLFEMDHRGIKPDSITLAVYPDEFHLTGCIVEESFGFEAGIVYTLKNRKYTIGSNIYLTYEYMRNASANLTDIPQMMLDTGWPMETNISSFEHEPEGLMVMAQEMIPDAKEQFNPNRCTPMVIATQSRDITVGMSSMGMDGLDVGRSLNVDLGPIPVVVSKTLKMTWYNKTDTDPVELHYVLNTFQDLDMEDDDRSALSGLIMAWSFGEERVSQIGPTFTKFDYDEHKDVISTLLGGACSINSIIKGLRLSLKVGKTVFSWLKFITAEPLWVQGGQSALKVLQVMWKSVGQIKNGFWGVVNKLGPVLI